ncbi:hypothetical protein JN11_01595 [Mucilaginibacter frigoritolerans]|uniref:Outer membrane protein with beta-barrel domain n=1 Tax=Mucilaginibacter frigoritolerans TaxID=652788 RepID=A0A562U6T1_9SPHI|nr:hypothetical protein [Mucilaginibacter frigoritolerans]TWJ01444.1 hypothetical protein JN11_01595 [Mucilaginibacter frigoritolerans]
MKKKLLLAISAMILAHWCNAQSVTSPTVTLHGSYITTGDVSVNPYLERAAKPTDSSIHFRIKKGTKFYVNQQITVGNTITGYVVTVWDFNDTDTVHENFYASLRQAQKGRTATNDSTLAAKLATKKEAIKSNVADSAAAAKKADTLKVNLANAQKMVSSASTKLLTTALKVNAEKTLAPKPVGNSPKPVAKPEVANFVDAQTKLKLGDAAPSIKANLISAVLKLSVIPDTTLANSKAEYVAFKKQYDDLKSELDEATREVDTKTKTLLGLRSDLQQTKAAAVAAAQTNTPLADPNIYKRTKEQLGEKADTPADPASPYAAFADLEYVNSWGNGWSFFMSAQDFSANSVVFYPTSYTFTWGFLTLPIKLRFDNSLSGGRFNFEQNLNFGLTAGIKQQLQRIDDVSLNYLGGLSVVNVPLNNASTAPAGTATSTAAVSLSGGVMFQYAKFQMGVFIGWDFAGDHAYQFSYQGRPWLGFAIGLSLFGASQTTATAQSQ